MLHMHAGEHHFPSVLFRDDPLGRQAGTICPCTVDEQIGNDQYEQGGKPYYLLTIEKQNNYNRKQDCEVVKKKVFQGD